MSHPLSAEAPHSDVDAEARTKQCDYIVYTTPTAVKEPSSGGLPAASLPKGRTLDRAKYQAVTAVTLYKVDKPQPELGDGVGLNHPCQGNKAGCKGTGQDRSYDNKAEIVQGLSGLRKYSPWQRFFASGHDSTRC